MNENRPRPMWFLPLILAAVTALSAALLMFSQHITKTPIAEQQQRQQLKALELLIPQDLINNDLLRDAQTIFEPDALGHRKPQTLYLGKTGNQTTIMAIPVTARNGYSGDIDLMVGVLNDGQVTAIEILQHKETPGLGDLIERKKSDWLHQFPGRSIDNPSQWKVKKDGGEFDQITAATITPRAVVGAINKALTYHQSLLKEVAHE